MYVDQISQCLSEIHAVLQKVQCLSHPETIWQNQYLKENGNQVNGSVVLQNIHAETEDDSTHGDEETNIHAMRLSLFIGQWLRLNSDGKSETAIHCYHDEIVGDGEMPEVGSEVTQ